MFILMPVPHCLHYYCVGVSPSTLFFFKIVLAMLNFLWFHVNFIFKNVLILERRSCEYAQQFIPVLLLIDYCIITINLLLPPPPYTPLGWISFTFKDWWLRSSGPTWITLATLTLITPLSRNIHRCWEFEYGHWGFIILPTTTGQSHPFVFLKGNCMKAK